MNDWRRLAAEKVPLIALAVGSSVATYVAQSAGGAVKNVEGFPLTPRLANAVISYLAYLTKTVWPVDLAVFYPHPAFKYNNSDGLSPEAVAGASVVLLAATVIVVRMRRRAPYLLTGWLWYLGTLVPVIGIVQVGNQGYADRYTYFPQVGLLLALSWGVADIARDRPRTAAGAAAVVAVVLTLLSSRQLQFWRTSFELWTHAYGISGNCPTVLVNLGELLDQRGDAKMGDKKRAFEFYSSAVKMDPKSAQIRLDLGTSLQNQGKLDDAAKEFELACNLAPTAPYGFSNLGAVRWRQGKLQEARQLFETASRLPGNLPDEQALVLLNLGLVEVDLKELAGAEECFEKALLLRNGNYPRARAALGDLLVQTGRPEKGFALLNEAVKADPNFPEAHYRLAKALEKHGNLEGAAVHFGRVVDLNPSLSAGWFDLGFVLRVRGETSTRSIVSLRPLAAIPGRGRPLLTA